MKKEIRTADIERGIVQITTFDERWYAKDGKNQDIGLPEVRFVPSVTWIAGHYPKGIAFYKWLADRGWDEAEAIKAAAGDKGSRVHQAVADLVAGKEVRMDAKYRNPSTEQEEELTVQEYEALMSFKEWFDEEQPEVLASEYVVFQDEHGYAGTVDLKLRMKDGFVWIVDVKTSQSVWPEYELQVSAYRHAEPECTKTAILQIGYNRNKTKKFKFTEIEDRFDLFLAAKRIWKYETEGQAPSQKDYPLVLALRTPQRKAAGSEKSVCCNASLIGGAQCETCGADGRVKWTPRKGTKVATKSKSTHDHQESDRLISHARGREDRRSVDVC